MGWIYTLVVVAGTVWLARRVQPAGREPVIWLVILVLATMRSPFMATYAAFPSLWLATLVTALAWRASRPAWPAIACWCALALNFGPASIPPKWNAVSTTIQTLLTFVLLASVLRQLRGSGPTRTQEMPAGAPARVSVPAAASAAGR